MGPVGSIGALRSHYGYTFRAEIFAYDIGRSTLRSALPTPPTTRANRKTAITVSTRPPVTVGVPICVPTW